MRPRGSGYTNQLKMLNFLHREGEAPAMRLVGLLNQSRDVTYRTLNTLMGRGMLIKEKRGKYRYYKLSDEMRKYMDDSLSLNIDKLKSIPMLDISDELPNYYDETISDEGLEEEINKYTDDIMKIKESHRIGITNSNDYMILAYAKIWNEKREELKKALRDVGYLKYYEEEIKDMLNQHKIDEVANMNITKHWYNHGEILEVLISKVSPKESLKSIKWLVETNKDIPFNSFQFTMGRDQLMPRGGAPAPFTVPERCPECGGVMVTDYDTGLTACRSCGLEAVNPYSPN